ncbi:conserved protein of unknown function [Methylocaldum szegediense]|uniref:Uncharacterized protein n=2 Tax=Methylocaldum szegediense TaxID=73780 RepID=A0ABN8X7B0_9GAMM|nr:hypothetical protein [Methylocaldum szegediense]CAI8825925.1 conserved protein of unknown function [Methylocaldum szegediense]
MSMKSGLIKMAIKLTPNRLVIWVANRILKGIAELTKFRFDLDARQLYVQTRLYGEQDTIDVCFEGFGVFNDGGSYKFIVPQATSNRPWLNNLLSRIAGKAWQIPAMPPLEPQLELAAELFKTSPEALQKIR